MFNKGLFGGMLDFNHDGNLDSFERAAEFGAFMQMIDDIEKDEKNDTDGFASVETDELSEALSDMGLDVFDFELMDDDEKAAALEQAGLDPDDFDF